MVILETSRATVNIARGAAPTADIVLGTIGGALQTGGVSIDLLDSDPTNIQVGITMVHDATGTTAVSPVTPGNGTTPAPIMRLYCMLVGPVLVQVFSVYLAKSTLLIAM